MDWTITLTPMGTLPSGLVPWLKEALEEKLELRVEVSPPIPIPTGAHDRSRQQYDGGVLLDALRKLPVESDRVLGIADVDCYSAQLNFIFGQAVLGGREALIALPRLRPSFYGLPQDETLFRQRVLKEALHELGHTWDLAHCPNPKCVMHFSNTLRDTDVKQAEFCSVCRSQLT